VNRLGVVNARLLPVKGVAVVVVVVVVVVGGGEGVAIESSYRWRRVTLAIPRAVNDKRHPTAHLKITPFKLFATKLKRCWS